MKTISLAAAILFMVFTGQSIKAYALSPEEIHEKIELLISQRHPSDKPEDWRRMGPEAVDIIIQKIESTTRSYTRLRLIGGLAFFGDSERAVQFLKKVAQTTDESLIRHSSLESIFLSQGEKELEFLSQYLAHPDAQTRAIAAESLSKMKNVEAQKKIEEWAKTEKTNWVKEKAQGNLPVPQIIPKVASNEIKYNWNGIYEGQILIYKENRIQSLKAEIKIQNQHLTIKSIPVQDSGKQDASVTEKNAKNSTENTAIINAELKTSEENPLAEKAKFYHAKLVGDQLSFELHLFQKGAHPTPSRTSSNTQSAVVRLVSTHSTESPWVGAFIRK